MYLAQIAAKKEYSYLLSMYEKDFPVPKPIEINRHAIVMQYIDGVPLSQVIDCLFRSEYLKPPEIH